jgi:flagellar protein FlaG
MISTISQSTSVITVSVGREVRVHDSSKPSAADALQAKTEKNATRKESPTFQESQSSEQASKHVEDAVIRLQNSLQHVEPRIELSVDKDLKQVIVRVIDKESGDLIRQIPSEDILQLDRFFADQSGLFVEEEI